MSNTNNSNWRERFTEKFWIVSEVDCYWDLDELFAFIESEIARARESAIEECIDCIPEYSHSYHTEEEERLIDGLYTEITSLKTK